MRTADMDVNKMLNEIAIALGLAPWPPAIGGWEQWFAAAAAGEWA